MRVRPGVDRYLGDVVDERPGFYYVSVQDYDRYGLLRGPFTTHADALAAVDAARAEAVNLDPKAHFYAFGTLRSETDLGPGVLP